MFGTVLSFGVSRNLFYRVCTENDYIYTLLFFIFLDDIKDKMTVESITGNISSKRTSIENDEPKRVRYVYCHILMYRYLISNIF